ncbi:hypothetical protein HK100_009339 [Physocladia obscura]|uniref:Major facilitator superfamily (MFS) profile domain-containing protein n=1 Tax=Physocladia obscura TaxID=109957 RepID=A0AAD5X619_9FUNG|nr:hypothetical protein HK100_009339 [Physocladia obscura]
MPSTEEEPKSSVSDNTAPKVEPFEISHSSGDAAEHQPPNDKFSAIKVPLGRVQFILVYVSLLVTNILSSLDQTIVTTTLKNVVAEFGQQELISWIGTAFLFTAAPLGPLYGKFADIFGRKTMFLFALITFEIGSLICGVANSMEMLIVGRAVAGVGGGGLFSLIFIILSDIVSIQDRGIYQGPFVAAMGLSLVIAPLIGGAFSDYLTWRWCYFINLPFGAAVTAVLALFLKFPPTEGSPREKIGRIDGLGAALLFAAIMCFLTPLQLGGSTWAWNSGPVIGMFITSVILFLIFAYVEVNVAKEPIVPITLFINRSVAILLFMSLFVGAVFFGVAYYLVFFYQVVYGYSATNSGVQLIPFVIGIVITSILCGILMSRYGRYTHFFYIGPVIITAGTVLISYFTNQTSAAQRIIFSLIFGIGIGNVLQSRTIGAQASVPHELIAVVTALVQTGNTLGGAIGESITGTIINNLLTANIASSTTLQYFIEIFISKGLPVSTNDIFSLLEALEAVAADYPKNNTAAAAIYNMTIANATSELIDGFNGAFKSAILANAAFPVLILLMAPFVQQFQMKAGGPGIPNQTE